jgi:hypothetical protein
MRATSNQIMSAKRRARSNHVAAANRIVRRLVDLKILAEIGQARAWFPMRCAGFRRGDAANSPGDKAF